MFNSYKCGKHHGINKHSAFSKSCKVYGKLNHYALL